MVKPGASLRINVRACDYQRMLDDLLARQPCDRWLTSWADANRDWVYGERHNRKARQLVEQGTGAAQQQALDAYNACLAGNPLAPTPAQGLSLRVASRLRAGSNATATAPDPRALTQRLTIPFGGEVVGDPACPPVSEAVFLRDDYGLTWFSQDSLDPLGQRNYRFEVGRDFSTDWTTSACPDYDNYFCFYGAPAQNTLFELRLVISRLYELTRTVVQEKVPPAGVSIAPYDVAAAQTSDAFMTWRGAITQSPLLARFVFEYVNAETGELVWQYPNANGSDFPDGWFPLSPHNASGSGTGAKSEPWWGLNPPTPPRWGNWTVRCICLALRMRETWSSGMPIQHPDLLMAQYPWPGGGTGPEPRWQLDAGITAYTPGMTDGLARFERISMKVAYHGHSYRCEVDHVQVLEGIGYLFTIHFTNDTKFDFWYAYRAASVAYYRADGSYVWGPGSNSLLMFHLPPFASRTFRVLQPLDGYWQDWGFLGDLDAPTPGVNPYANTLQLISNAVPIKPAVAESLWTDVRDGDAETRKALISTSAASSNQAQNWYACMTYPPAAVLASPLLSTVSVVTSGDSGQRLGTSYSLAAYVTYRDADAQIYSTTRYFPWSQLSAILGLPSASPIEIPLDGTGHTLVRNIGWSGGTTQGYCTHALINRCDYWTSWDDFKARIDTAVRGLLPGNWNVLVLDLRNPYVGFDFAAVALNDVSGVARSGIVPSVSESAYPTRLTVRV